MGKTACCEKSGLKKGPWTVEEDHKLIDYITKRGAGRWRMLPKIAGLKRCGKSCRLRWTNYLRPDIKRGKFSFEEEETIIQLHSILGNKWSTMAARLPGRTDNEIKNYWNTHIRKKLLRMGIDPVTHTARRDLLEFSSILSSSLFNNNNPSHDEVFNNIPSSNHSLGIQPTMNPNFLSLAAALLSSQHNKTPEFVPLNLQNNQLCNHPQFQNHFQTTNIQACATSSASGTAPFLNDAQLMQANNTMEPFSQSHVNFGYQNDLPNLWQNPINMAETFVTPRPIPKYDYSNYNNTDEYIVDPLSINPPMVQSKNSSSSTMCTVNGSCITTEDEKDSYCSNMLMLDGFM